MSAARAPQARAIRTRDAILYAAGEIFEEYGYTAATVEQIAERAQTTKGAVYFHFASKAALAAAVVAQQHAVWGALAVASAEWQLNALDTMERLIREVTKSYAKNPLMRAGVRLANEQAHIVDASIAVPFVGWIERLTGLLRAGQHDGSVRTDLNCAASARAVVASFYGVEEVSARLTGRRDLDRRVREWWALMRPGLASTPDA